METNNLTKLIGGKWFDKYQNGIRSRFSASGMSYSYHYEENNSIKSIVVLLGKENVKTKINFSDNGNLNFHYTNEYKENLEEFENCTDDDFHTMLAHAFLFIRDGNFDYHKEWHANLKRKN